MSFALQLIRKMMGDAKDRQGKAVLIAILREDRRHSHAAWHRVFTAKFLTSFIRINDKHFTETSVR